MSKASEHKRNPIYWESIYSETMQPDKYGRWQRAAWIGGNCIGLISVGEYYPFKLTTYFPSTELRYSINTTYFDNLQDAKEHLETAFDLFLVRVFDEDFNPTLFV